MAAGQSQRFYSGVGIFNWHYLSLPPQILRVPGAPLESKGLIYIYICTYIYIYTVYNIYTGVCVCFKVETTGVAIEILYICIKYLGRSISILRQLHLELSRIFNHFWVQFQEFSDSAYYSVLRVLHMQYAARVDIFT